jgi:hypothetical protein
MPGHPPAETWRKIGIRAEQRLVLLKAPTNWGADGLPPGVTLTRRRGARRADSVVAFYRRSSALARDAPTLGALITPNGAVWVAWPRKAAGHVSDLGDEVVRATLLPTGLVDVKVAALDEDWSGLKFVWRVELRPRRES